METVSGIIRAKSRDKNDPERDISLSGHIIDLLKELEMLETYFENNPVEYGFMGKKEKMFESLVKAIFIHDLGKIYYNFQDKVWKDRFGNDETMEKWKELKGFLEETETKWEIRHEVLSLVWSVLLLDNGEFDKKIRTAILLHHYNDFYIREKSFSEIVETYEKDIKNYLSFIYNNRKMLENSLRECVEKIGMVLGQNHKYYKILNNLLNGLNFEKAKELSEKIAEHDEDISEMAELYDIENENPDYDFLVFLGLLRRCDYSGSGGVKIEAVTDLKKLFKDLDSKVKENIGKNEIWQEKVLNEHFNRKMVLVAPTGSGKTEFALLWSKKAMRKFIYTLPLRVALNDIYARFKGKEGKKKLFDDEEFAILHSTSFIEYVKESMYGNADIDIGTKKSSSELFSYPVMLTTPDQVFLTSLHYYGSDKLISLYPQSAVLIDEIQAYDPEMSAIILRTLEIINKLKGDILIITATMPPYFRKFLANIGITEILDASKLKDVGVKNLKRKRHKIEVVEDNLVENKEKNQGDSDENNDREWWEANLKEINKIFSKSSSKDKKNKLIIVNNVSKAIELSDQLKNEHKNVFLLHSRMIEKQKSEVIDKVREAMNDEGAILVATQIVEASVDLDFDMLITEISPIDSQIQRWGRVHRSRDGDYNGNEANIYVFTGKNGPDEFSSYIYDKEVMKATSDILKKYKGKFLGYSEEKKMIDEVFEEKVDGEILKEKYENKIEEIMGDLKYFTAEKKSEAQRIFRKIAGYRFVVPDLMKKSKNVVEKEFAEIIKDRSKKDLPWKVIVEEIIEKTGKSGKEVNLWVLKKILYEYSFTMPAYYFEKARYIHVFKDFYVLDLTTDLAEKIREYGFDKIKKDVLEVDREMRNIW